ncbi:D-amino acid dehydrogenase [Rhodoferax sp. AJA081-3]|uniref:D-amino acid dehydrogenase n=1 Tax=Rhodoferax sp. AJA081-3 TaxID=2752316 RepID=UPI001AE0154B|nr:D-amino acid dehydrogenase [Rhodoferax sp. AJA081-3]QTN26715.1 D-amino acid dehydrogenase [Rhodoferax sp. AJA081-3]
MKVCVIGAGVVGCSTAYQLARMGCDVHLVDEATGPGLLTSYANGAQLSYSYVEPLASPHTLRALPGLLAARHSPLRFTPRLDWRQWRWGLQFLRACTRKQVEDGTSQLLRLSQLSRDTLVEWMQTEGWSFDHKINGKLVLCPDDNSLKRQDAQIQFQRHQGCHQQILSAAECVEKEPALQNYSGKFAGGVWTADERVGDPYKLCLELVKSAQRLGATVSFNTALQDFVVRGDRLTHVRTGKGELVADAFVLATGVHAAAHAAKLGMHVPVYPIKGYSITVPMRETIRAPQVSITELSLKTVFAPLGQNLRVAAMAEIGEQGLSIPAARIQQMLASVESVFPGLCDTETCQPWAGLRPATPTSIPIVGRSKYKNLFLNVGHGALGLTLAAGSAVALSQELMGPA